jgi:hypothetical protein
MKQRSTFCWLHVILIFLVSCLRQSQYLHATALPNKFIAEVVTDVRAIKGTFATNPRNGNKPLLLLVSKEGQVYALEDPDNSPHAITILDLDGRMCTNQERGLQTIAIDPNFDKNRFVYLYYSKREGECTELDAPWNVIDRFTMNSKTLQLDLETRTEIWR